MSESQGSSKTPLIVTAVDGSMTSGLALDLAVHEACDRNAELLIVHVVYAPVLDTPFMGRVSFDATRTMRTRGEEILVAAQDRATRLDPSVRVRTQLLAGPPTEVLLRASAHADVIIVGSRGLGLLGAAAFGSVSSGLAIHAKIPVIVVPPDANITARGTRVVLGVDAAGHSPGALTFAIAEAKRRNAELVLVGAWHIPSSAMWIQTAEVIPQLRTDLELDARAAVDAAVERARQDVDRVEGIVVEGDPIEALLNVPDTALVVVGSRGFGMLRGLAMGSVGQALLRRSRRAVAIVHGDDDTESPEGTESSTETTGEPAEDL